MLLLLLLIAGVCKPSGHRSCASVTLYAAPYGEAQTATSWLTLGP